MEPPAVPQKPRPAVQVGVFPSALCGGRRPTGLHLLGACSAGTGRIRAELASWRRALFKAF